MKFKKSTHFKFCILALAYLLCACDPSRDELDAQGTEVATSTYGTHTAEALTPTHTLTKTPTDTPKPTDTTTPSPTLTSTPTFTISPTPDDGKYRPPQGNYSCDFSSIQLLSGKKLRENYLLSSFETVLKDDFGTWYSIEYMRLLEDELPIPEDFEDRQKYLDFGLNYLMERRIKPEVPQGKILDQEYLHNDSPILFAILDLPGGSNISSNNVPNDATRAVYIVIHGAYRYVISTQFTIFSTKEKTEAEIIQELKQDLEKFYQTCEFETDLEVGKNFIRPTITPIPDPMDFIPDMDIPEGLFFPDQSSNNVDGVVQAAKGDWIQIMTFPAYALIPIPAGWTASMGDVSTLIMFSPDGNLDDPPIYIRMSGVGYIGDDRTSEEVIMEFESKLSEITYAVFEKKIVDADKGYIFLTLIMDDGSERYLMVVFSEDVQGYYHRLMLYVYPEAWNTYYPIARAMVENWVDLEFRRLGMNLPEEVSTTMPGRLPTATPFKTPTPTPRPPYKTRGGECLGSAEDAVIDLDCREITIMVENAKLPFNYVLNETNEPGGWDYDAWNEICTRLHCTPVYVEAPPWDMIQDIADGQYDVAANGIAITEDQAEIVDTSEGYISIERRLLVRVDETRITEIEDVLNDDSLRLGANIGTNYATAYNIRSSHDWIQRFEFASSGVQALISGDIDALVVRDVAGLGYVSEEDGLVVHLGEDADKVKFVGRVLYSESLGFIYPKGSDLVEHVNLALQTMMADGFIDDLNMKYFGPDFTITYDDIGP